MRTPPNLKFILFFLLAIALITLGVIYLPQWIPGIGAILMWILCGGMVVLIFFTLVKPMLTFLYARTDGIFEVYKDGTGKGFHVFGYHLGPSPEFGDRDRDIQHYYISYDKGKVYYKRLFSHSMTPASGRSGWGDFYGFEESVLPSKQLIASLQKFSTKTGLLLQLQEKITAIEDNHYRFDISDAMIEIKKFEEALDEGMRVVCKGKDGSVRWKIKI